MVIFVNTFQTIKINSKWKVKQTDQENARLPEL